MKQYDTINKVYNLFLESCVKDGIELHEIATRLTTIFTNYFESDFEGYFIVNDYRFCFEIILKPIKPPVNITEMHFNIYVVSQCESISFDIRDFIKKYIPNEGIRLLEKAAFEFN